MQINIKMIIYDNMKLDKLSIKTFIGDLPRILNKSLEAIETAFNNLYNTETHILGDTNMIVKCRKISIENSGNEAALTTTGDIKIIAGNKEISLLDLYDRLVDLENAQTLSSRNPLNKKKLQ